jgi:hypothetical protein
MKPNLVCVLMFLGYCVPAYADCGVMPWSIPYLGSNTSTSMSVGSGEVCRIDTGAGGTNIITSVVISAPATSGTASTNGADVVMYQSQAGYTGPDSFTFTITGSGPGGSGSSSIQVSVTVQ